MIEFFPSRTVLVSGGGFAIHWYGVMYALGFWIAYALLPHVGKLKGLKLSRDAYTMLIVYGAVGVLVGGRVGYALFYEPGYFLSHPLDIFAIWHGGMSSHGGFIGVACALWMWAKKEGVRVLAVADTITVPVAIGLALGRLGNVINQEFGVYPYYEIGSDLTIALVCYLLLRYKNMHSAGTVISIFLILYSIARFILEYIRPQEWAYTFGLTRGQFLTIPVFAIGVLLFLYVRNSRISSKI